MEVAVPFWQALSLSWLAGWVLSSSAFDLTRRFRSLTRPWVARRVHSDTTFILRVQRNSHGMLDAIFSVVSCVVSVPFYTGFLPLLFWSGHSRLARQMTLLMAFCDYIGNAIKDLVAAPRPSCPPVRRVTATKDEEDNVMEYGLPSSHALNTVCLSGYLLHYVLTYSAERDGTSILTGFALVIIFVMFIGIARIYLGMHSLIDIVAGISIGLIILGFWLAFHGYVDDFIVNGRNVTSFWAILSLMLLFAYPTPEVPTPSYEYHAAFSGVAFGVISGVQLTHLHFHHEDVPRVFSPQMPLPLFLGRILIGIPTILIVKLCSKAITKWLLPMMCNTLCIPIWSSCYIPALKGSDNSKQNSKHSGYFQRFVPLFPLKAYDVDTGIRFLQYAALAWSVVDLVPSLFLQFNL